MLAITMSVLPKSQYDLGRTDRHAGTCSSPAGWWISRIVTFYFGGHRGPFSSVNREGGWIITGHYWVGQAGGAAVTSCWGADLWLNTSIATRKTKLVYVGAGRPAGHRVWFVTAEESLSRQWTMTGVFRWARLEACGAPALFLQVSFCAPDAIRISKYVLLKHL